MAFCTKCGAQIGEGDLFCGKCGAKVGTLTSPTSNPPLEHEQMSQTTDTRHAKPFKLILVGIWVLGLVMIVVGSFLVFLKQDYGFMNPFLPEIAVYPWRYFGILISALGFIMFFTSFVLLVYHLISSKRKV